MTTILVRKKVTLEHRSNEVGVLSSRVLCLLVAEEFQRAGIPGGHSDESLNEIGFALRNTLEALKVSCSLPNGGGREWEVARRRLGVQQVPDLGQLRDLPIDQLDDLTRQVANMLLEHKFDGFQYDDVLTRLRAELFNGPIVQVAADRMQDNFAWPSELERRQGLLDPEQFTSWS